MWCRVRIHFACSLAVKILIASVTIPCIFFMSPPWNLILSFKARNSHKSGGDWLIAPVIICSYLLTILSIRSNNDLIADRCGLHQQCSIHLSSTSISSWSLDKSPTAITHLQLCSLCINTMVVNTANAPSSSRPPLTQLYPSQERNEAVAGEFWTIKRDGEDWPVIICDEEIVWTFFKGRVRPFNARQADGTWPEDYKSGGSRVNLRCYPAVMLGKLKL